ICIGDSGGPLVQINDKGAPILVGVTSFTRNCEPGFPSGFAKISARKVWIEGFLSSHATNSPTQAQEADSRNRGFLLFGRD
ncbi:Chymotrypsinogen B, partial [Basidiobolus ranarum]